MLMQKKSERSMTLCRVCTLILGYMEDYVGTMLPTSGFWPRMRVVALSAPVFLGSLTSHTVDAPPPIAASLLPKNKK